MSRRICVMMVVAAGLLLGVCQGVRGAYIDEVVDDGPRGYWRLGETTGSAALDSATGDGSQDGQYSGGHLLGVAGALADDSDTAVRFDGTNGQVTISDSFDPTAYTIEAWVRPDQIRGQSIFVRTASNPNTTWSHQIRMTNSGTFQAYTYDGSVKTVTGTTVAQVGQWYHVVATAENNDVMRLYVDGVEEGSPAGIGTLWQDGGEYLIGSESGGPGSWDPISFFDGTIDEVALYLSPLSEDRIDVHHTAGIPEPGAATLLLVALSLLLSTKRRR